MPAPAQERASPPAIANPPAPAPLAPLALSSSRTLESPAAGPIIAGNSDPAGVWAGVREAASSSRYLGAMLAEMSLESLAGGEATLAGAASIVSAARTKLNDLEQLFARVTGRPIRVALRPHEAPASAEQAPPRAPAADHPLVRQAIEQLGARIVAVHPRSRPSGAAP